ncbi:hypothetical protein GS471_30180 [Rhodococcus hoagii]|nr:hypothetical protein [Prescottella equi]
MRCGIVDKFEEFVGCVDLVGEIVDFAEVLDVVRQQEVDTAVDSGAMDMRITNVGVVASGIDCVALILLSSPNVLSKTSSNPTHLCIVQEGVLLPQVVLELDHDVVGPLDLEHVAACIEVEQCQPVTKCA